MREIARHNYEEFFVDYLDGKLTKNELEMLELFLETYPELKKELESIQDMSLEPEAVAFDHKDALKKTYNDIRSVEMHNMDELVIAKNEGDLSLHEISKLNKFIDDHPQAKKEASLIEKTFLKPDLSVTFPNKSSLKKFSVNTFVRKSSIWLSGVAAAALLFYVGFNIKFDQSISDVNNQVTADNQSTDKTDQNTDGNIELPMQKIDAKIKTPEVSETINEPTEQFASDAILQENIVRQRVENTDERQMMAFLPNIENNQSVDALFEQVKPNQQLPAIINNYNKFDYSEPEKNFAQKTVEEFSKIGRSTIAYVAQRVSQIGVQEDSMDMNIQNLFKSDRTTTFALDTENFGVYRSTGKKIK